jgi:hypothetical protein
MRVLQVIAVLALLGAAATAGAGQDLPAALIELERAIQNERGLSPEFKQALGDVVVALREQDRVRASAPAVGAGAGSFFDRVRPFADLRLRHEWDGRADSENRNRERVRFRFGATSQVNSWLQAGFRVRTGSSDDPQSPYHDFGRVESDNQMLRGLEFSLDRVFMTATPEFLDGFYLTIGKFGHPFVKNPVFGELVWDDDVQPEGVVAGWRLMPAEGVEVDLTAGQYLLLSQDSGDEFSAFVAQAAAEVQVNRDLSVMGAVGWYRYGDTEPDGTLGAVDDNRGNSVNIDPGDPGPPVVDPFPDKYLASFHILNPIASATYRGFAMPVTLAGEYVLNTGADGDTRDGNQGFALGASLGETRQPGDWSAFYQYQRIERDAVFSPFSQDDFRFGTNFKGHTYGVRYQASDRFSIRGWGLTSRPDSGPRIGNSTRLRLDLDAKF